MAVSTANLAVTTTAGLIVTPTGSQNMLAVTNPTGSGVTVYIGGPTVSSTNYYKALAAGDPPMTITDGEKDSLSKLGWYIRASGSGTVYVTTDQENYS